MRPWLSTFFYVLIRVSSSDSVLTRILICLVFIILQLTTYHTLSRSFTNVCAKIKHSFKSKVKVKCQTALTYSHFTANRKKNLNANAASLFVNQPEHLLNAQMQVSCLSLFSRRRFFHRHASTRHARARRHRRCAEGGRRAASCRRGCVEDRP